jgi:hypothetical protein
MLRDVVVHILNEQPLRADLVFEPASTDNVLVCRNLRTMNGKKPTMADHADSMFMLPFAQIRFVEIPQKSIDAHEAEVAEAEQAEAAAPSSRGYSDAAPLERLAWLTDGRPQGEPATPPVPEPAPPAENDGLDDDLLRRIREL